MEDVRQNNKANSGKSIEDLRREEQERIDRINKDLERQRKLADEATARVEAARAAETARIDQLRKDAIKRANEDHAARMKQIYKR